MAARPGAKRPGGIVRVTGDLVREFAGEPLKLVRPSALLVTLSVLDLLMTYMLLNQGFHFYESNPVAQWWFKTWNIAGMTVFKFLVVGIAIVASEIVERRRPGVGRAILSLGNLAASIVVIYSSLLFYRHMMSVME
jgi:hypothetical protein